MARATWKKLKNLIVGLVVNSKEGRGEMRYEAKKIILPFVIFCLLFLTHCHFFYRGQTQLTITSTRILHLQLSLVAPNLIQFEDIRKICGSFTGKLKRQQQLLF